MYQRILVGVDSTEASATALREAQALATASAAELMILHVLPDFAESQEPVAADYAETLPRLAEFQAETRGDIERHVATTLQRSAPVSFEAGEPAATIVRNATALRADLIVVGSHGRSGLERFLLGSVAQAVVRSAPCPVLVSRTSPRGGLVLVATDLSEPSMPALALAIEDARQRGARLTLVHAVESYASGVAVSAGGLIGMNAALPPPELQAELRGALTQTLHGALERFGATGEVLVVDGKPAAALVEAAAANHADVLVVGTHGRTGISRLALGSVAEDVLRTAPCSVLVVRQSDPQ